MRLETTCCPPDVVLLSWKHAGEGARRLWRQARGKGGWQAFAQENVSDTLLIKELLGELVVAADQTGPVACSIGIRVGLMGLISRPGSELVPKNWTDGLALDLISKPRERIRRR
jgi:hypothetical protein